MDLTQLPELVRSTYNVYYFTPYLYKVVKFKSTLLPVGPGPVANRQSYDQKLEASLSRSRRVVLELALCNHWDWFCTFTLSPEKEDRFDLEAWYKRFTQWLRDQRKKGLDIAYLIVPEKHENGAWHAHGLFRLPESELVSFASLKKKGLKIAWKLVKNGYLNWPAYEKKFGFCSFAPIRSHEGVSHYITKYITKSTGEQVISKGGHIHRASLGLNRPQLHGEVYGPSSFLDGFLQNEYEFVRTGFAKAQDEPDWVFNSEFNYQLDELKARLQPYVINPDTGEVLDETREIDEFMNFVQLSLFRQ